MQISLASILIVLGVASFGVDAASLIKSKLQLIIANSTRED